MTNYFIYYAEANIICFLFFGVMLLHDLFNATRQETQIQFDRTLTAFMVYFISDTLWAAVDSGALPVNTFSVVATNFANNIIISLITYSWLRYVMAVEKASNREKSITQFAIIFPFLVSVAAMVGIYLFAPRVLLSEALEPTPAFFAAFLAVPYIYIVAVIVYVVRRARSEENPAEKFKHLFIGLFPLMVIAGGLVEIFLLPELPLFCFASTILMLVFYIQSMERQISMDPLTGLNNRGQLLRYISQKSSVHPEGRPTFVLMIDVNDFKKINDTFGHAEGDRALILIADVLRRVFDSYGVRGFLGRYGGDEFILIIHPLEEEIVDGLVRELRAQVRSAGAEAGSPYVLSISVGFDALAGEQDTFQKCILRSDRKLYQDKARSKRVAAAEA